MSNDALMWFGIILSAVFCGVILAWVARWLFFGIIKLFARSAIFLFDIGSKVWLNWKKTYKARKSNPVNPLGGK